MSDPDFVSGEAGVVAGPRAVARAIGRDLVAGVRGLTDGQMAARAAAGAEAPVARVLAIGVDRAEPGSLMPAALRELRRSKHEVTVAIAEGAGERGKFENLNALLAGRHAAAHDWLLVIDDDVRLPRGFLDGFLGLARLLDLSLAQPAHRAHSHAAWSVTRRVPGVLARETQFVEIGPVTALRRGTFPELLPFPALRYGWGLDLHWSALARLNDWKIGVVDATPIAHRSRVIARDYAHDDAIREAEEFLRGRAYVPAREANRTLAEVRELPR